MYRAAISFPGTLPEQGEERRGDARAGEDLCSHAYTCAFVYHSSWNMGTISTVAVSEIDTGVASGKPVQCSVYTVCDPIAEESLPAVPESESVHESDIVGLFSVTVHEDAFVTCQKRRVVPPCRTSDGCACRWSTIVSEGAAAQLLPLLHP